MPPKDEDDDDDGVPLGGLKKVIAAEKIIEMRRQEKEALAAEPSLGFNEEWCKANQARPASSFKIRDLYGHMMPSEAGQPSIPTTTSSPW